MSNATITHEVIDTQTGRVMGQYTYANRNRARRKADSLDLKYGAIRYRVRQIFENFPQSENVARMVPVNAADPDGDFVLVPPAGYDASPLSL